MTDVSSECKFPDLRGLCFHMNKTIDQRSLIEPINTSVSRLLSACREESCAACRLSDVKQRLRLFVF